MMRTWDFVWTAGSSALVVALAGLVALGHAEAWARDIFVNNQIGDDAKNGRAPQHLSATTGPVRTIAQALKICQSGDRIVLAKTDQPYRESLSLCTARHCGTPDRPFVIDGNGAVLEGAEPVPPQAWRHWHARVFRFRPVRLDGHILFLEGKPAPRFRPKSEDQLRELPPGHWALWGAWVYFAVHPGRLPQQYPISYCVRPAGITLYQVHDVVILNLTIQGFRLDGVHVADRVRRCTLGGLLCRGNGRSGVFVGGAAQVHLLSSLVGNNAQAQLMLQGYAQVQLEDCDLIDHPQAPAIRQEGPHTQVIRLSAPQPRGQGRKFLFPSSREQAVLARGEF